MYTEEQYNFIVKMMKSDNKEDWEIGYRTVDEVAIREIINRMAGDPDVSFGMLYNIYYLQKTT